MKHYFFVACLCILFILLNACTTVKRPDQPTGDLEPVNKTLIESYPNDQ